MALVSAWAGPWSPTKYLEEQQWELKILAAGWEKRFCWWTHEHDDQWLGQSLGHWGWLELSWGLVWFGLLCLDIGAGREWQLLVSS